MAAWQFGVKKNKRTMIRNPRECASLDRARIFTPGDEEPMLATIADSTVL
jgi:hypothetical protein